MDTAQTVKIISRLHFYFTLLVEISNAQSRGRTTIVTILINV